MNWLHTAEPSSVLAFVSTIHVSLLLLRQHRSVPSPRLALLLLPSLAFAAAPWFLATPAWLVIGLAAHVVWFTACERLLPERPAPMPAPAAGGRPLAPVLPLRSPSEAARAPRPALVAASQEFMQLPVLAVFQETEDTKTFRMERPPGFDFRPGQFLTVRVQVDGRPLVRCYSISSAPEVAGYLEITVKRIGLVSSTLHATVRPGSRLAVKGPAGAFCYPGADDRPIVLLAGGVGITPLMSMLRHAVSADPCRPVVLLYAVRNPGQLAYRRELAWISDRQPQVRLGIAVADGTPPPGTHGGMIDERLLRQYVPDPANALFMVCGPTPMMDAMKRLLASVGVPDRQVRQEVFAAAVAMAGTASAPPRPRLATDGRKQFRITLRESGLTASVSRSQTLLEAVEAAGANIPSSCRAGVCLTCRCRLIEGDVDCQSDSLDASDRSGGFILPCVSWAKSDCVLEA